MNVLKPLFIGAIICLAVISCNNAPNNSNNVEITGTIQKQGITIYQYGTHTISGYALRSSSITLDDYVNQMVTIVGQKIEGYPVDGGPEYIDVKNIK